ncbi:ATP-binding protein [Staphylococcus gallinarum]|jgi:DNA replication protein DnaC|uniref:DNA replication protein DnaC n=1 Tax=Staphylococcus gallinarum TaxID=1293 RepID=A0A418HP91_STAGA|nr:ATP-binding protein [Staphylococcus gallinarum]MCQ9288756.1 ATP-binding protein [Staphylococcus gallinarum]PTE36556.1 DNA replication protein DnaC [Staphylococcus gallinarum]PTL09915.1 DNA replication protein DnaC [Staphylococcus gallinarum]RIL31313.1 DNA replication protein DnaC [Staphylococcus gallinarum]RIL42910.1 DNA replication protein DnaC [Staphylococcus gallinarum]
MNPFESIASKVGFKNELVKQEYGLKCDKCGRIYDYYEFDTGYVVKDGCDCEMIKLAKERKAAFEQRNKSQKANNIFKKSIINDDLANCAFDNYKATNEDLARAKALCERYANNFTLDNKQSLLLQGSFGTGKSHLSMSIVKTVKEKGYSVLYMNVPQLISTIKGTYNKDSNLTEQELNQVISDVDLMVFDDFGINMNEFATSKMFELIESRVGKHNIYTTNLNAQELSKNKDAQRIFSRMMSNTTLVKMDGEDYRMRGIKF